MQARLLRGGSGRGAIRAARGRRQDADAASGGIRGVSPWAGTARAGSRRAAPRAGTAAGGVRRAAPRAGTAAGGVRRAAPRAGTVGGAFWGPPPGQAQWAEPSRSTGGASDLRALVLAAADPANPYGAALAWPARPDEMAGAHKPGRKAGALVVLADGSLVLYVERGGRTLLSWTEDPEILGPAASALARAVREGALGRLTVERADGAGVYESPLAQALRDAGFRPTPRGLRLRK